MSTIQTSLKNALSIQPEKIAVEYNGQFFTRHYIYNQSVYIADVFRKTYDLNDLEFVGVYAKDRLENLISMLALFMSRCVFIPLNTDYPPMYIKKIIKSSDIKKVIVGSDDFNRFNKVISDLSENDEISTISYDSILPVDNNSVSFEYPAYDADDPIYVYYTSGSTGNPNAIVGRNESLLHFIEWEIKQFNINESDKCSQLTVPSHDPFLRDLLVPLISGGTLVLFDPRDITDARALIDMINTHQITHIHCTPTLFHMALLEANIHDFSNMRRILIAGEELTSSMVERFINIFGNKIQLVNLYGPTEATLASLFYIIKPEDVKLQKIPIGKPISDVDVIILDDDLNICETREIGEIYINSSYMSHGYYNNDALNEERFIINPFNNDAGRLFKTSDLAYHNQDGNIIFISRKDSVVKLHGYQVDLSAITSAITELDVVRMCVVKYFAKRKNASSQVDFLVAYYISNEKDVDALIKSHLNAKFPHYMIPAHFVKVNDIPLTTNGKIDYEQLPEPHTNAMKPETEMEHLLVEIWKDIFAKHDIGITDNFFDLGGHSLLFLKLEIALEKNNIEIDDFNIYEYPTIKEMALYISGD